MKFKSTVTAPFLVLCVFILTLLVSFLDTDKLAAGNSIYLAFLVIELMVFTVPCVFYCKLKGKGYTETLGLRPFGMNRLSLLCFLMFVLLSGVLLIKVALLYAGVLPSESEGVLSVYQDGNLFYTVFTASILPAIVEELLFRGVILSEYAHLGGICSVFVSALFFAMLHFSLAEFPIYFFGGIVMGAAAYLTRSLFAAIMLHMVYNLFTMFGESFVWKLIFEEQSHIFFLYLLTVVFLLFLVLSIGESERIFYSYAVSARGEVPFVKRNVKGITQALSQIFMSIGFLLCVVLYAVVVLNSRG